MGFNSGFKGLNPSRRSYYVSCFRINDTAIMS